MSVSEIIIANSDGIGALLNVDVDEHNFSFYNIYLLYYFYFQ